MQCSGYERDYLGDGEVGRGKREEGRGKREVGFSCTGRIVGGC